MNLIQGSFWVKYLEKITDYTGGTIFRLGFLADCYQTLYMYSSKSLGMARYEFEEIFD